MRNEINNEWLMQRLTRLQRVADRQANVIVIEDMPTMRLLLVQTIRQMGFKNVHRAANGKQGLELIQQHHCDLAIVDWVMPHMTGLELLEKIRDLDDYSDMIFVMVTAESHEVNVVRGVEERVDTYLTKPVNMYKLTRRLNEILFRRETESRCALQFASGRQEAALKKMGAVAKKMPEAKWPLANLAKMYARSGRFDIAEKYFQQILKRDSSTTYVLVELGKIKEREGDTEAALKYYHRAIYRNNQFFRAYDVIAEALLSQGNKEDALLALETAMQNGGTESAGRQELFADLLLDENRFEEAESALRKAMELKPQVSVIPRKFRIAKCCLAQGKVDEGIEVLEEVVKSAKRDQAQERLEASLLIGKSHLANGDVEKAVTMFERLIEPHTWPGKYMPEAKYNLLKTIGKVYLQTGNVHQASKYFYDSVLLNLDDQENIKDIGYYADSLGFPELGGAIEEKISDLRSRVEACAEEGRVLVERGEYDAAHKAYDQGLRIDPNSGRLYFNKGRLFLRMDEMERCFIYMERALEFGLANRDAELVAKVAQTYLEQDNFPRTRRILELAHELDLEDESIHSVVDMLQARQPVVGHALTG